MLLACLLCAELSRLEILVFASPFPSLSSLPTGCLLGVDCNVSSLDSALFSCIKDILSHQTLCWSTDSGLGYSSFLRAVEGLLSVDSNPGVWEDDKSSFTELCGSMDSVLFGGLDSTPVVGVEGGLLSPTTGGVANESSRTKIFDSVDPVVFSGLAWFLGLDEDASAEDWV
jgi:hypothetical protein